VLLRDSASASLNEPPPELQQLALYFLATFLVVILENNNRHTSARAKKIFPIRNMRPLIIHEPTPGRPGGTGDLSTGSGFEI